MNLRQKITHMKVAHLYAGLSYCVKRRVGCVIELNDRVISIGYNGTQPGEDNCCEDPVTGNTIEDVTHAEVNALNKIPLDVDLSEAVLFVTTSPCTNCAEVIVNRGIKHVIYDALKRTAVGIDHLIKHNVRVEQLTP